MGLARFLGRESRTLDRGAEFFDSRSLQFAAIDEFKNYEKPANGTARDGKAVTHAPGKIMGQLCDQLRFKSIASLQ